jgi:ADP-ribosylglycohydrolase
VTDDTAMALMLADSLIEPDGVNPVDLMSRFLNWREQGAYSWGERNSAGVAYELIAEAIRRKPRSEVLAPRTGEYSGKVLAGCCRAKAQEIQSSDYIMDSLR